VIYDFQGIEKTEAEQPDDARLYLVVWSLRENKVYSGSLTLRILDHGEPVHSRDFPAATEENIYSLQHTLPETGRYSMGGRGSPGPGGGCRRRLETSAHRKGPP
jgi:hypothetical protein